jgi:hypothetical protein
MSYAYVAHFVFFRDAWIRTQRVAEASKHNFKSLVVQTLSFCILFFVFYKVHPNREYSEAGAPQERRQLPAVTSDGEVEATQPVVGEWVGPALQHHCIRPDQITFGKISHIFYDIKEFSFRFQWFLQLNGFTSEKLPNNILKNVTGS